VLLEDLVGQDAATAIIRRAHAAGRVGHAYLFEGPPGIGKRAAANGLALLLNCDEAARGAARVAEADGDAARVAACGRCEPCRRILAGIHPDVIAVAPSGTQILMEQAQSIVALAQSSPHEARARVIVVDDADRMNPNAANCLLKTLEEPTARTHIVLVTSAPERLLPTIRSRTQRIRFRSVASGPLLTLARRRGVDPHEAEVACAMADGRVGRFLELLGLEEDAGAVAGVGAGARAGASARPVDADTADPELPSGGSSSADTRRMVIALREAAGARDVVAIFDAAAALGDKASKGALPDVLGVLGRLYRDALAIRAGASELALFTPESAEDLRPPIGLAVPTLGRALEAIVETETALGGNVNAVMALEHLLIQLNRAERRP
jgi:DNA polymerase-3 subunit delta'